MNITKREILVSIAIISILLAIGFLIAGKIGDSLTNNYQEYNTAVQIDRDKELFGYSMRTNVGNAFIYGDLTAVDTISIPDIPGLYSYIYKLEEHHIQHTRVVTTTDSKGHSHTHVEHYWTWDAYRHWEWHCKELAFLGCKFDYNVIPLPDAEYYNTIYKSGHVRFVYYVCKTKYTGTLYTNVGNDTIKDARFYNEMNIESTIKWLESGHELILFWCLWILFIGDSVFGFYYLENRWLE